MELMTTVLLLAVLHLPAADHGCHLQNSDWWTERLTTEYVRQNRLDAILVVSTSDGCLCLVRVAIPLLLREPIVISGRTFIGAGWQTESDEGQVPELMLKMVCESFEGCVARKEQIAPASPRRG